jgi:diguanylate cyclase (GGDEF)-like protein/PAS domain S-box-containing protein
MEDEKSAELNAKDFFEERYGEFSKSLLDAWAVVDSQGRLLKCNMALSKVTGMKSKDMLKAESFDHSIRLEVDGKGYSVMQLVNMPGPGRVDEVAGSSEGHSFLNLIIGYFPFLGEDGKPFGCFILLRDVTAETQLQGKYVDKSKQSITDKLTNLFNRNYFDQAFPKLADEASLAPIGSVNGKIAVIMFDIDKFKSINDNFGHQEGDAIIAKVAGVLKNSFRKSDIVCRYGGEEFLAILPGSGLDEAGKVAEKVRKKIELEVYMWDDEAIPNSISIGVAAMAVGSESTDQAVARADAALYQAKHMGRNRVMVHRGGSVIEQVTLVQDIQVNVEAHRASLKPKKKAQEGSDSH